MKKTDRLAESYRILGVSPGASLQQIKKVFHHKALLYHPDANPAASAAAAEFKNITRAYGIIRAHLQKQAAENRLQESTPAPVGGSCAADCDPFTLSKELSARHRQSQATDPAPDLRAALEQLRNRKLRERDAQVGELALRLSREELGFRLEHSDNPFVRLHAVRALAVQGGKPAEWLIIRALADPDENVVRAAAEALGALRARPASMPLIRLHQKSNPETRQVVHAALERISSPLARRYLDSLQSNQRNPAEEKHSTDIA